MLTERQQQLLKTIVESYIQEVQPVASGYLVGKMKNSVSSATIRNEMVFLEKENYIEQPHTSAGRIPTEKAYNYYVENLMNVCADKEYDFGQVNDRTGVKTLAKRLTEITGETVVVAFDNNDFYYTGISNLFSKVEFEDRNLLIDMSQVIDHLDSALAEIFDDVDSIQTYIGQNNPFGTKCSSVVVSFPVAEQNIILAIIGPMRMNYAQVIGVINYISDKLN